MKKTIALLAALAGLVVGGCSIKSIKTSGYRNVTTDVFESQIKSENVQILDVRTKKEFDEGHLAEAKQIDIKNEDFMKTAKTVLDKSKTIAVYCRSGKRSADAAKQLSDAGYKVINMKGGILKWESEKKPIVK
ncbi:rhodanese-like domain-containing protein [Prevotella sp. HCN-7019]|uniref:rhodanese-like domain-containing protein n=1 Tax=Prevotella sp. HCN-7019 TaxID=3134668 RepID=UPI0030C27554